MVLLLARCFTLFTCLTQHAYYVSVCEIYHNSRTQALEISIKIFADDLELALRKNGNPEVTVVEEKPDPALKEMLFDYLNERFIISIDKKATRLHMVGYEFDDDVLLCYVEIKNVPVISLIEVHNNIITEVYEEQINLTHFQYLGKMKSLKTTGSDPSATIDTSVL
jgi:hypothetical protein